MPEVKLLECTLRDGGFALEDAVKNKLSDLQFSNNDVFNIINHFGNSGIDIVELGSVEISDTSNNT